MTGNNDPVFVIAEAGVNHNGDPDLAHQLVDAAAKAGANAIKFQTFDPVALTTHDAPKAEYQGATTEREESQRDLLTGLRLPNDVFMDLQKHSTDAGIEFLSTPFDRVSLEFLSECLGLGTIKIGSGDLTDGPLLFAAARTGCKLIISTGMSTINEVAEALDLVAYAQIRSKPPSCRAEFRDSRQQEDSAARLSRTVTLLHYTSAYPAPEDEVNLRAMATLDTAFPTPVGYSDHTAGIVVPIAAVAAGATVIEKHLTLDRDLPGPDHSASIEPAKFAEMVSAIRRVERAMGIPEKNITPAEADIRRVARKSLVAARSVKAGELLSEDDLTRKRPGDGVSPMFFWDIIGSRADTDLVPDQCVPVPQSK